MLFKIKFLLYLLIASSFFNWSTSQVLNIDRENGQDSTFRRNIFSVNFGFNLDKQKRNLLEFSSQLENDFFLKKKNLVWISLAQTDASFNGSSILENNGYFQMRLRDNDKRLVYPDYFIQYQWNGVWGLQNRALAGCNARFRFWENKKDDLYAGIGLFYEYEKWNPSVSAFAFAQDSLEVVYRYIPRLNLTAKTAIQLKEGIDLSASSFVQFPMNDRFNHFLNPRWFIDLNLFMAVTKHLSIQVHYDHNFDSYRPLPIDNWYYNFNIGFQLKW
jgi:hypothetical protein